MPELSDIIKKIGLFWLMAPVQGQEPVSDGDFPGSVLGSTGYHITRDSNVCRCLLWSHPLLSKDLIMGLHTDNLICL